MKNESSAVAELSFNQTNKTEPKRVADMNLFQKLLKGIEFLAEWTGLIAQWLVPIVVLTMTYEVIMRFGFHSPTFWSYDITIMLGGMLFLLPCAYAVLHERTIRVDIFYTKFSSKKKDIIDIVFCLVYFFPAFIFVAQQSWRYAIRSIEIGEIAQFGFWEPTMIPFRFGIAIALSLFLLEVVSWFVKKIYRVTGQRAHTND